MRPRPVPEPAARRRAPRPAAARAIALLALAGLAALAWRHVSVVRALEGELADERGRVATEPAAAAPDPGPAPELAELELLRAESTRLESELADARRRASQAEARLAERDAELARAQALADDRDGLRTELESARIASQESEARAREAESRAADLEDDLRRALAAPPPAIGPTELRAELCDRVLTRVEAFEGEAARTLLQSGRASGLFAGGARDGSEFLDELAAAATALERARLERSTSTSPASAATLEALDHVARASAGLAAFEREGADWLARDPRGGAASDPMARLERARRALAALEAEGARLGGDVDQLHVEDWTWLASRGPLQDPTLAAAHAERFGCAHLRELAADARDAIAAEVLVDGVASAERLLETTSLPLWAQLLASGEAESRDDAERELLWLDAARRWYALGDAAAEFPWHGLAEPEVVARGRDWRAELWLRVALAGPDSAWPPRTGELDLYRLQGPSRASWRSDRRIDGGSVDGWTWQRTHYDAEGVVLGEPHWVEVEVRDGRVRLADAELVLLDLRSTHAGCEVAPAPAPPIVAPPAATGFGDRAVLGLAAEATRATCLVVRVGDTTRWFSPRLGMLLEERELASGSARVELVLREVPP